ncbi:MAG: tRNA (adenosine(37)-N6)-threonylcarbamoyltransferase complex dimerization subunit type 1 TsaB [Lactobacillales bacterium]|jgi:tRNA threonylcarbamoyl adenosine modification protein YeaZ|nr:tRNA (adenosine(37)-N6)-threonylcarbamoyltransferase complex dimerization subunit type 1 TsaB [Lactobacillales bacterium]
MKILAMDTSNKTLSVALVQGNELAASYQLNIKKNHSITLMPAVDRLMKEVGWCPAQLDKIIVSDGPGSYTGVRMAVTTSKTLSFTLKKPLIAVSSLALLAQNAYGFDGMIVPLFDARRGNVYAGVYQFSEGIVQEVLEDAYFSFSKLLFKLPKDKDLLFLGEDVQNFQSEIESNLPRGCICKNSFWNLPKAENLVLIGRNKSPVANIHTFVPRYLKRVEAEEKWLKKSGSKI